MTKRKVSNKIDKLEEETGSSDADPLIMNMAHFHTPDDEGAWPDIEDSPHRDLTVKPWPERKPRSLKIAVPNVLPNEYRQYRTLTVVACDGSGDLDTDNTESGAKVVPACELWESMTREQLTREFQIRTEKNEAIPDRLQPYATK